MLKAGRHSAFWWWRRDNLMAGFSNMHFAGGNKYVLYYDIKFLENNLLFLVVRTES